MVGGRGPPVQQQQPPNGKLGPPTAGGTECASEGSALGVRLMQEPGFAAHDSHLYKRQTLSRVLEGTRQEGKTPPFLGQEHEGEQDGSRGGRISPSPSSAASFFARASSLSFHSSRKARCPDEKEKRRRRSPISKKGLSCEGRARIPNGKEREDDHGDLSTNFRAAVTKISPPVPVGLLKVLGTREVPLLGKVRVHLRESPTVNLQKGESSILILDKKRRQVTLQEPRQLSTDSRVGVSAPKIFAYDQVFSRDESQTNVINGVLPDILQAVLAGNDGCILCFGSCQTGKSHTMVGSHLREGQMGVIPSAIAWLYRSIAELKSKSGVRFSVRVSALAVDAPGKVATDVLGEYAQDSETSPGALLREGNGGLLASAAELRAPSPETASRYLDLALSAREAIGSLQYRNGTTGPATLLYTLHIYQYSVDKSGKGGVIGGRSRLHLLDLGDMSGRCPGGLSLSGLSSVLLAIFNGQKYLPHRENKLTYLLQDTLGSLTCHAAMLVHVSPSARHLQHTLATLQLASRVHRMRRKKIRGLGGSGSGGSSEGSQRRSSGEDTSAGSSSLDFSSSEQSADTVIYIGGGGPGDSTDGEHPPIFMPHHIRRRHPGELPRLRSLEQLRPHTASPVPIQSRRPASASPTPTSRSVPLRKGIGLKPKPPSRSYSNGGDNEINSIGPPLQVGFFRHQPGVSKIYPDSRQASQIPLLSSFKPQEKDLKQVAGLSSSGRHLNHSVYQEPNAFVPTFGGKPEKSPQIFYIHNPYTQNHLTQPFEASNEKNSNDRTNHIHAKEFIRQNFSQMQKAHHLQQQQPQQQKMHQQQQQLVQETPSLVTDQRQTNGVVSDEQWIDGPRISKSKVVAARSKTGRSETWIDGPSTKPINATYGFMDDHKKTMIERWVENQTAQVVSQSNIPNTSVASVEAKGLSTTGAQTLPTEDTPLNKIVPLEEGANESDVDTLSEAPSGTTSAPGEKQPNLIEELERKNLIPVCPTDAQNTDNSLKEDPDSIKEEKGSPVPSNGEEPSIEDICSQCEALAEECEELNSLLSCEEEECKRQIHQGLATVMEEPELESALGADDKDDDLSLLNHPQTDCDEEEVESEIGPAASVSLKRRRPLRLKTADSSVQVCHEDIIRCMSDTPCPSEATAEASDDHPLRVLSEENLTCASTFTDSFSHMGETGDEDDSEDEDSRPLSLFEVTDYNNIYKDITDALHSDSTNKNLRDLANIHDLFRAFSHKNTVLSPDIEQTVPTKEMPEPICQVTPEDSSLYSIELVFDSEDTLCKHCNKKKTRHKNIYKLSSYDTDSAYHSSQQTNLCQTDKCIGTEESSTKGERCDCSSPTDFTNHSSCTNHMSQNSNVGLREPILMQEKDGSNSNLQIVANTLDKGSRDVGGSYIENGIPLPTYIKDVEANVVFCDSPRYSFQENEEFQHLSIHQDDTMVLDKSDNESDCPSTISEDSEYIMQNSKFSKFLCVGISKSKSKVSLKNKQNKNCESKRNLFKSRETKVKSVNKVREASKSPDANSKNLIGSPSRSIMQNIDRSSSSHLDNKECVQRQPNGTPVDTSGTSFKYRCAVCYTATSPPEGYDSGFDSSNVQGCSPSVEPLKTWTPQNSGVCANPIVPQPIQPVLPKHVMHSTGTSGSVGTTQSLGESSGYESIPRDSECSSFSSSQESEMDEEHRKEISTGALKKRNQEVFKRNLHSEAWCPGDPVQDSIFHPAQKIRNFGNADSPSNGEQAKKHIPIIRKKTISSHWTNQFKHNRS